MVHLTDVLNNTGNHRYNLTVDFTNPNPTIWLGGGTQNYESDLIANPLTLLNFSSSENSGVFASTYGFEGDEDGEDPSGWSITETGGTIDVISDYKSHFKIVELEIEK